ncbi:MAG: fumarate reductase subunit C [Micromonosporaceae bacterium]|nr:fumarate reductase subunit C [Micromonosporaceae bacterium]
MTSYQPPMSLFWWLRRRSYFFFAVRELSSVFVAWFVVYLLLLGHAVASGEAAYREFVEWSARPWLLGLNLVALVFVVFHAVTWFRLAPQAMVVRVGGRRAPPLWVAAGHYAAWVVVSALVVWVVLA